MEINLMVKTVQDYVRRCMEPFAARIKGVEDQLAALPVPKDGNDADPEVIRAEVERAVGALPKPKDGEPGTSFTAEEVQVLVDAAVAKAIAALPAPKDGDPGKDVDPAAVKALVEEAVAAIPKPQDGKSIPADEARALVGELFTAALPEWVAKLEKAISDIPRPKDGEPGKSVTASDFAQLFEAEQAKALLDFERRAQDVLQRAIDKIPAPKDGVDGIGIEDLALEHDGDGGVTFRFVRGELRKEFTIRLPRFKVKGGYREGADYLEGDGVSFGGSFYVSLKDEPAGKPGESVDWWLAAKKGRDGKNMLPHEVGGHKPVKLA